MLFMCLHDKVYKNCILIQAIALSWLHCRIKTRKRTRNTILVLFFVCGNAAYSTLSYSEQRSSKASLQAAGQWFSDTQTIMGTNIEVQLWANDRSQGIQAIKLVMSEMQRINLLMSTYIETSEVSLLNKTAYSHAVSVSQELFDLLLLSKNINAITDGAFDITYASVGHLYQYADKQKPNEQTLAQQAKAINMNFVVLDASALSVKFIKKNVRIDLGGIAKGHAVDASIKLLEQAGIRHALVTAGGDTKLLGDRLGKPWIVGIRDPRNRQKQAVIVPLENTAMSTSGDYERYFEQDGLRYHHILSPKTGKSATGVQSVSIISDNSTVNDALSTAVFVMGVQAGLTLINKMDDVDAIIMDDQRKMHYSKGLVQ